MRSILEEFAYRNLSPEVRFFDTRSEYGKTVKLAAGLEQKLLDRLGAGDKDLFEKYVDAQQEANQLAAVKNLIYGYRLGLMMTAEAFVGIDGLYAGGGNL